MHDVLAQAADRLGLSTRGYLKIFKLARTIAGLEGAVDVQPQHITEALQYRLPDVYRHFPYRPLEILR